MKDKTNLLIFIFLILLSINYASNQTFKIHKLTDFECSPAYGIYKFKIEAKNITTEQKLTPFYIYLNDTGSNLPPHRAICNLDNEEVLKAFVLGKDEPENINFTCFLEDLMEEKTIELQILGVNDLNLKTIPLDIYGGYKNTISFAKCEKNPDEYYSSIINKKISLRQVSHYEPLVKEKKIKFLLSAITSQTLPANYGITVKISLIKANPLEGLDLGEVEIPQIEGNEGESINGQVIGKVYDANCVLKKTVKPLENENELLPLDFECTAGNLEEFNETTQLVVLSSYDINGFTNLGFLNPSEIDDLIGEGIVKDVSNEAPVPPIFTPTSINTEKCEKEGIIYIKGKFDKNIEEEGKFNNSLLSGNFITCEYEKYEKNVEVEIKCYLLNEFDGSTFALDFYPALEENKEVFFIKPILYIDTKNLNCPIALESGYLDDKFLIDISFRQVAQFQIIPKLKTIMFNFYAVVTQPIKMELSIYMVVNLIKGNEFMEAEAICTPKEIVEPKDGQQLQADFNCVIEVSDDNIEDYSGLEIKSSEEICGLPDNPDLLNPAKVDKLISINKIKDYSLPENKNEEIPLFNAFYIDTNDSEITGKFTIYGEFLTEFILQRSIKFEIILLTGEKAICTLPKLTGKDLNITIECVLQKSLNNTKIIIQQIAALDGFNEIIRLGRISTEKEVNVADGKNYEIENALSINLLFGQISTFITEETTIKFIFVGITTTSLKKGDVVEMAVNLIKGKELVEYNAICSAKQDIEVKNEEEVQIEFECIIDNIENGKEWIGLEFISSGNITGIPTNEALLNPANVDKLIKSGKMKNYTAEELVFPKFNGKSIDTSDSEKTGKFIINGEI